MKSYLYLIITSIVLSMIQPIDKYILRHNEAGVLSSDTLNPTLLLRNGFTSVYESDLIKIYESPNTRVQVMFDDEVEIHVHNDQNEVIGYLISSSIQSFNLFMRACNQQIKI